MIDLCTVLADPPHDGGQNSTSLILWYSLYWVLSEADLLSMRQAESCEKTRCTHTCDLKGGGRDSNPPNEEKHLLQ